MSRIPQDRTIVRLPAALELSTAEEHVALARKAAEAKAWMRSRDKTSARVYRFPPRLRTVS